MGDRICTPATPGTRARSVAPDVALDDPALPVPPAHDTAPARPWTDRLLALFPVWPVLVPFVVSRLLAGGSLILGGSESWSKLTALWFVSWDGQWYLGIAQGGFGPPPVDPTVVQSPWPFFPLLPGMVRALAELGLSDRFALVALNHLAFLLALAGVWRLVRRHAGHRAATYTTWATACFPIAIVFSMGYPSSVFLAASVWAVCLLEEHHDVGAAALALVATAVRPNGIVVAVVLVAAVVLADRVPGPFLASLLRLRPTGASLRRAALVGAPSVLFVVVWCALCWRWTGDPFVFWTTKAAWHELTIVQFVRTPENGAIPHAITGVAAIAAFVLVARRFPLHWSLFALLYLGPPLVLGVVGLGRYANECFPVMAAGGVLLDRMPTWLARVMIAVSAAGLVLFGVLVSRYRYLP